MAPEARSAWGRALEIAKGVGDTDYQLRSLWGLWVDGLNTGGFKNALSLANQFYGIAAHSSDPLDALMGDRMIGIAQHFIGEQRDARQHIDRMLARYVTPIRASQIGRCRSSARWWKMGCRLAMRCRCATRLARALVRSRCSAETWPPPNAISICSSTTRRGMRSRLGMPGPCVSA